MTTRNPDPADLIARDCLAVRARLLSRVVCSVYDEALRPLGLKASQLNVLVAIQKLGPCAPGAIADALQLEKSSLSRNVERLRQNGWVAVEAADDARSHRLVVTAAGTRLLAAALEPWRAAQRRTRQVLGADGAAALRRLGTALMGTV